jgi:hypothetical protein
MFEVGPAGCCQGFLERCDHSWSTLAMPQNWFTGIDRL